MTTTDRADALASLAETDWSGAVVHTRTKAPSMVHSVRLPREVAEKLAAEAARRGIAEPSVLIREFILDGLARSAGLDMADQTGTLRRLAEQLHRAIDDAVRAA